MLTEYQFSNFKAFSGPATIPIKPITLIFGANSSGKSSIFQSLLMLKQTAEAGHGNKYLLLNGPLIDLGRYAEMINGHDIKKAFSFKITLNKKTALDAFSYLLKNEDLFSGVHNIESDYKKLYSICEYKTIGLKITFCYDKGLSTIQLFIGDESDPISTYVNEMPTCYRFHEANDHGDPFFLHHINFDHDLWKHAIINDEDIIVETEVPKSIFDMIEDSYENGYYHELFPKLSKRYGINNDYMYFWNCWEESFSGEWESRFYAKARGTYFSTESDTHENIFLYMFPAILAFKKYIKQIIHIGPIRDRSQYMDYSQKDVENINRQLELFDIGYQLKRVRFTSHAEDIQDEYKTLLYDKKNKVHVSLKDVGVGVSQILPVILQSVASYGKTLLIEQPELHLHPALQTELGDVFISAAMGNQKNSFLIETHSEHLILRILRRIRETTAGELPEGMPAITPNDVAVLYVKPGKDGSEVIHIPVNEDGEFDKPWPDGFFSERARELF